MKPRPRDRKTMISIRAATGNPALFRRLSETRQADAVLTGHHAGPAHPNRSPVPATRCAFTAAAGTLGGSLAASAFSEEKSTADRSKITRSA